MTTISNNKLPEWRKALNSAVENYQSMRAWYEENPDNPSAEQDMDAAEGEIETLIKQYGVPIVLSLMDEIDELQELHRSCLALRGEIEDVQEQLYEAENRNNADDEELQERRKADSAEPLAWTDEEELRDLRKVGFCEMFSVEPISKDADMLRVIPLYRHAQPVSVVPDGLRQALSNAGIAAPESDEMLAATCEKYIQMLVTWVKDRKPFQPALVVPEEMPKGLAGQIVSLLAHNIGDKLLAQKIWNVCRAAMLQSKYRDLSQPVDHQISEYEKIMLRAGWVMVPVEPTDEMIAAAMNCEDVLFNSDESFCVQFGNIYEAMLAAAPQPEISDGK